MSMKKWIAALLALMLVALSVSAFAEDVAADTQKLDASYTLALNAINAEDYETAKEYLNICFAYCDAQTNPTMYADLLLKQACIAVLEEQNDTALQALDAALEVQPELADAYLVRTQVYISRGETDAAVRDLEKYIALSEDASLYESVAQLYEAMGATRCRPVSWRRPSRSLRDTSTARTAARRQRTTPASAGWAWKIIPAQRRLRPSRS